MKMGVTCFDKFNFCQDLLMLFGYPEYLIVEWAYGIFNNLSEFASNLSLLPLPCETKFCLHVVSGSFSFIVY